MRTTRPRTASYRFPTAVIGGTLGAANVQAQSYDLSWNTVDGGGDASIGGIFSISATIGQPDAGEVLSGGTRCWSVFIESCDDLNRQTRRIT